MLYICYSLLIFLVILLGLLFSQTQIGIAYGVFKVLLLKYECIFLTVHVSAFYFSYL